MKRLIGAFFALLLIENTAGAVGELKLPYDSKNSVKLGSWVDVDLPVFAKASCLKDDYEYEWETDGAINTVAKLEMVTSLDAKKEDYKFSILYKAKAAVAGGDFGFSGDTRFDGKYGSYAENERHTLSLVFTAKSDYGRRFIRKEDLKPEYKKLIQDGSYGAFREKCGTHYITAESRVSEFSVIYAVTGLSQLSKQTISAEYENKLKGNLEIFSGDTTMKSTFSSFVETAKKTGNLTVSYYASGGEGISGAATAITTADPKNVDIILKAMSEVANTFTRDNSGIESYSLRPGSNYGAEIPKYDEDRANKIAKLYEALVEVSAIIEELESYQENIPKIYDKYYAGRIGKFKIAKNELNQALQDCVSKYQCDHSITSLGIDFVNDIFTDLKLDAVCEYDSYETADQKLRVLRSISVNLLGKLRVSDFLDVDGSKIIIGDYSNGEMLDITDQFSGFSVSDEADDNTRRIFGTVFHHSWPTEDYIQNANMNNMQINTGDLQRLRDSVMGSFILVDVPTTSGIGMSQAVGSPSINVGIGDSCAAVIYD